EALLGMEVGHELIVITWLHEAKRDVLKGHPRNDESRPLTGVFYTRSRARPNPLGLHPVIVREIDGTRIKIGPIEAFDGTPVVDIKSASTRADSDGFADLSSKRPTLNTLYCKWIALHLSKEGPGSNSKVARQNQTEL